MDKALDEIYRQYAPELYAFILRMCCNEALAKDILQDTMLRAVTSDFKGNCSVKTWLCTIARNLYFDHLKRSESKNLPLDSIPEPTAGDAFEEQIADAEYALQIHQALHRLDEPYREIFTLRVFAELKFSDIGTIFGKSGNWAGVMFYRAKQKLIALLKEEGLYE